MKNNLLRWVASVYGRYLPELREITEKILQPYLEEDTQMRWMKGGRQGKVEIQIEELEADRVEKWTAGSRMEGRAAGVTRKGGLYLGSLATLADAEVTGVGVLRYSGVRQPGSDMMDTGAETLEAPVMGRRNTGGADGREAEAADVGTRASGGRRKRGGRLKGLVMEHHKVGRKHPPAHTSI